MAEKSVIPFGIRCAYVDGNPKFLGMFPWRSWIKLIAAVFVVSLLAAIVPATNSVAVTVTDIDTSGDVTGGNVAVTLTSDASGNLFVMLSSVSKVCEIPAGQSTCTTLATNVSANYPSLTTDSQGNIIVADDANARVCMIQKTGASSWNNSCVTISNDSHVPDPEGITINANGDIVVANYSPASMCLISRTGTGTPYTYSNSCTPLNITGLNTPESISVDGGNNIIVANFGAGTFCKVTSLGGTGTAPYLNQACSVVYNSGTTNNLYGLVADAYNNIYVTDYKNSKICVIIAGTSTCSTVVADSHLINDGSGITKDGTGNLYFNDTLGIHKIAFAQTAISVVVSSQNPATSGASVTFTATVTGGSSPAGTVTFYDNGTSIGTGTLNGSAQATFTTSSLAVGTHPITASYVGDVSNTPCTTSSTLNQVISAPTPTWQVTENLTNVTTDKTSPQTVNDGSTITFHFTPSSGYAITSVSGCGGYGGSQ